MTPLLLLTILAILGIHWIADFIFQAEEWATNKSKSMKALVSHTLTYSIFTTFLWFLFLPTSFSFPDVFKKTEGHVNLVSLFVITFVLHTLTDYITSRIVSRKFSNKEFGSPIPNFGAFSIIGFDQILHYTQLFGTYYLLIN